ncbi:MAG: hypothetical protein K2I16_06655 [Muribaculaceae bacterium]|nr:hypothetical protein [Muribaculaceae bacterium]MDE5713285.1 hypothetical protein [Muribaculaceae bacterium]
MTTKKKIKFDPDKDRTAGHGRELGRVVGKPNNGLVKIQSSDLKFGVVSVSSGKVVVEPVYSQILLTAAGIWGYLPKSK